eukprot:TRINITY_DN26974_c0_g1_i1.p1 TRINITY_DN26974_c0_g1~~TRINITY_DN26974_c0_g1_i1.p1  ORF type:complete len:263 (-),score=28.50 TRINITY_DN26974_c0_g1_i1:405-1193(-)
MQGRTKVHVLMAKATCLVAAESYRRYGYEQLAGTETREVTPATPAVVFGAGRVRDEDQASVNTAFTEIRRESERLKKEIEEIRRLNASLPAGTPPLPITGAVKLPDHTVDQKPDVNSKKLQIVFERSAKIRVKDLRVFPEANGRIGEILEEKGNAYDVRLAGGMHIKGVPANCLACVNVDESAEPVVTQAQNIYAPVSKVIDSMKAQAEKIRESLERCYARSSWDENWAGAFWQEVSSIEQVAGINSAKRNAARSWLFWERI